jgi:hypothetical protein
MHFDCSWCSPVLVMPVMPALVPPTWRNHDAPRHLRDQGVAGSNPVSPTEKRPWSREDAGPGLFSVRRKCITDAVGDAFGCIRAPNSGRPSRSPRAEEYESEQWDSRPGSLGVTAIVRSRGERTLTPRPWKSRRVSVSSRPAVTLPQSARASGAVSGRALHRRPTARAC